MLSTRALPLMLELNNTSPGCEMSLEYLKARLRTPEANTTACFSILGCPTLGKLLDLQTTGET